MSFQITRRIFLQQASLSMLAWRISLAAGERRSGIEIPPDNNILAIRLQLLDLVNEERTAKGLTSLKLDELACSVAQLHAAEMADNTFLSHWGRDGRKPYHRYSLAGGTDAIEENDAAFDQEAEALYDDFIPNLLELHKSMHDETPPHDGHRKTILAPQHTHVGFGMAFRDNHIRLTEIYVARYVTIDSYPMSVSPGNKFLFTGRILDRAYAIKAVEVYYEPLPSPPDIAWLRTPRSYGLPDERQMLLPRLPDHYIYEDGSKGSIAMRGKGRFRVPIVLPRERKGIYTIVVWIELPKSAKPFPATQVCVRAE